MENGGRLPTSIPSSFAWPTGNFRSTEINAVIGRSQLKRLDENNRRRTENFKLYLSLLDPKLYWTDFLVDGSVNYAFPLVMNQPDAALRDRLMAVMDQNGIEHRRGNAGGGNQLRQPYLAGIARPGLPPAVVDHIHFYGFYIGNIRPRRGPHPQALRHAQLGRP